ncbi:MAG: DNA translocase FtsK 4TM domain-containing protein, partial [Planctomycetota bacterium]|nr:DNA translocase FtsK 4TM domain-containing protein [Planctomycetota bacterium]
VPFSLLLFGLGCFTDAFAFARRRWPWLAVLTIVTAAAFDLNAPALRRIIGDEELPGGLLGNLLNNYIFHFIGYAGSTTAFLALYLLTLLALSDFQLFDWIRSWWERRRAAADAALDEEQRLERKARLLEKEARRLQEVVDRERPATRGSNRPTEDGDGPVITAKGGVPEPDSKPLPEPTVRDNSVPQARPAPARAEKLPGGRPSALPIPGAAVNPMLEGDIITATEIAAVTGTTPPPPGATQPPGADTDPARTVPGVIDEHAPLPPPARGRKTAPRKRLSVASAPAIGNYRLPSFTLLQPPDLTLQPTESKEEHIAKARLMQQTLGQFGIEVALGDITKGPTITRYELHPAPGVKLERISSLTNNIAAALKAERIHILAPVPGKSSVGIEVPNLVKTKVIMRDLLESEEWTRTKARIPLALGKDVYGHPMIVDLADMPHLLIAGSTGSGKSVCINCIIASLLYRFSPDQLRFVMIDPKVVELQQYNVLPHLVVPVVTDPKKVVLALRWVVTEMEKRYQIFAKVGVRNIKAFNERPKTPPPPKPSQTELPLSASREKIEASQEGFAVELDQEMVTATDDDVVIPEKLSYIVVIIDELADLMLVAPADVEMAIARITQMARAA